MADDPFKIDPANPPFTGAPDLPSSAPIPDKLWDDGSGSTPEIQPQCS